MSAHFDPYHIWLGIAHKDQPPHHYRLLGIDLFESNADVISSAADRQMTHVRSASTGKHVALAQQLLNEISAARICLLAQEKKAAYDSQLRAALTDGKSQPLGESSRSATAASVLAVASSDGQQSAISVTTSTESNPTARRSNGNRQLTNRIVVGAIVSIVLLMFLVIGMLGSLAKSTTEERETMVAEVAPHVPSKEVIEPLVGNELVVEHDNEQSSDFTPPPSVALPDDDDAADNLVAEIEPLSPPGAPAELPSTVESPQGGADEQSAPFKPAPLPQPVSLTPSVTQTDPDEELPKPAELALPAKLAVPSEDAQRGAIAKIKDIFKDDYAKATTDEGKKALADLLRQQAENLVDDPTARFVTLRESYTCAVEARDLSLALRAVRQLVNDYELDELRLRIHMLTEAARTARLSTERKEIAEYALDAIKEVVAAKQFDDATTLVDLAESLAVRARDAELRVRVRDIGNEVKQSRHTWEAVQQAITVLKNDPHDPAANFAYGRFLCLEQGNWEQGIPLLALGSDPELKTMALKELQGASSPESEVALGDGWWDLSQQRKASEKDAFLLRAGRWYKLAQPNLTSSLVRLTVEKRLEEIGALGRPIAEDSSRQPPLAIAPFDEKQARGHQLAWSKHRRIPVVATNSIGMKLALIPPGEFDMGSPQAEIDQLIEKARGSGISPSEIARLASEGPQHRVRISQPFYLGLCEVTQAEYQQVTESNQSHFKASGGQAPVENVSWDEAQQFCRRLSELPSEKTVGNVYRLPTEAEWEYACRAGTTTPYSFGDDSARAEVYAWFPAYSGNKTHPVGQKRPNAWGLHDMHGNVWEWCEDWWGQDFYRQSPQEDPTGPSTDRSRVFRGGSGLGLPESAGCAYRNGRAPSYRRESVGFRVAVTLTL